MPDVYRVLSYEEKIEADCYEGYSMLVGPDGFECVLTEPEDRTWYRDGKKVVAELNRLAADLEQARKEAENGRTN